MTEISVDIRELQRKLKEAGENFNPRPYVRAAALRVQRWIDQNFKDQGTERKWKALSPNTIAARRGGGIGAQILQDTGRLKQSFAIRDISPSKAEVGTNLRYAEYHNSGTPPYTIRPVKARMLAFMTAGGMRFAKEVNHPGLPKRPLLPTLDTANRIVTETIGAAIKQTLSKFNGGR